MQQPGYRDQSEPEVNSQNEESSQSEITEPRKQENIQLEHTEKEADALVSRSKSQTFTLWQAQIYTLVDCSSLKFQL